MLDSITITVVTGLILALYILASDLDPEYINMMIYCSPIEE